MNDRGGGGGRAERGEVTVPGFNRRGCSTRVASSVFGLGAEAVGAFVLLREVRFFVLFGIERAMVCKWGGLMSRERRMVAGGTIVSKSVRVMVRERV